MNSGNWEIGVSGESLDQLLSGEQAGMSLWFLAGYVKGITDSQALLRGERRMVVEPDGDQGWRLRSDAVDAAADSQLEAQA
ncbi:hypothetical protein [Vulcanococcus sp.]|jgi:hypothetical protein|uniref:hypothetical protein n=1 Tax=Vulcanococcus sp. TaxID=2856995 RepID=UPI0037D9C367